MTKLTSRLFILALAAVLGARADVTLPALLGDHMLIQRGLPVHVWGKAAEGESVSVSFRGGTRSTMADSIGLWSVYLPPGDAGGPFELTVKGNNQITLKDVLVGDVWVASGQSNMEFPVKEAVNATANALHGASAFADADQSQVTASSKSARNARESFRRK